jgi:hypothetical protein
MADLLRPKHMRYDMWPSTCVAPGKMSYCRILSTIGGGTAPGWLVIQPETPTAPI